MYVGVRGHLPVNCKISQGEQQKLFYQYVRSYGCWFAKQVLVANGGCLWKCLLGGPIGGRRKLVRERCEQFLIYMWQKDISYSRFVNLLPKNNFFADLQKVYHNNIPDYLLPVAETKIIQCSTFAVVCRLKSYIFTITSEPSTISLPDFPLVKIHFPPNSVSSTEEFSVRVSFLM